jgi:hypothetical protein
MIALKKKRNNRACFYALSFLSIIYPITPDYFRVFGFPAQLLESIVCLAFLILKSGLRFPKIDDKKVNKVTIVIILWALLLTLSYLIHGSTYAIYSTLIPWVLIMPYFIKYVDSKERFLKIIDFIIFAGFVVAILAIFEELSGVNVFFYLNNSGTDIYIHEARLGIARVYSFSSHPNSFCLYCMFICVLLFYRIFSTTKKNILFYKIAYIVIFVSACCTASRSTIIAIIISQLILLWLCGYNRFFKYLLYIAILLIIVLFFVSVAFPILYKEISNIYILIMAVFSETYADQLHSLGYQWTANGVADRFDLWNIVFSKMEGFYLFGHGPSTLLEGVKTKNALGVYNEKKSIEVQFLVVLYRYGIFMAIFEEFKKIVQIVNSYKYRKHIYSWESKIGFNKLCTVMFLIYFIVLFTLNESDTGRIYFLVTSLSLAYNYKSWSEVTNENYIIRVRI